MTFLHVVVARFRQDADPADVQAFLELAPTALGRAPFRVVAAGQEVGLGLTNAASWGYVAEVDDPVDLQRWEEHAVHHELRERILPIRESVMNIQIPVAGDQRLAD